MGSEAHQHHITPVKSYFNILGILLVLTVLTVVVAQFDFGFLNTIIAMAVASLKAYYVLAYFMHLKYDDKFYLVLFFLSIFFVVLLYLFLLIDISTRVLEQSPL